MKRSLIALMAALVAGACGAAEYQLLIHEHPSEIAKRGDGGASGQDYWSGYEKYGQSMQAAGVLRGGGALQPSSAGRRVHVAAGTMAAGPIAEAPLQVGGWFVIDVADLQSALVWASRAPSSTRGGSVEVRPLVALPSMAR